MCLNIIQEQTQDKSPFWNKGNMSVMQRGQARIHAAFFYFSDLPVYVSCFPQYKQIQNTLKDNPPPPQHFKETVQRGEISDHKVELNTEIPGIFNGIWVSKFPVCLLEVFL